MVCIGSLVLASSAVVGGLVGADGASLNGQTSNTAYGSTRRTNVIVTMKERTNTVLQQFAGRSFDTRRQRIYALRQDLQEHARSTQARVFDVLNSEGTNSFTKSDTFWLTNQVYVAGATPDLVNKLKEIPNVQSVFAEQVYPPVRPISETTAATTTTTTVQWGVGIINAPKMWGLNRTGAGVTVGIIDTGARYTHQDLRASWRQSKGWFDPEKKAALPYDATGHGTHVTGIITGANGIGVAPGAKWIMCKGCRSTGCFASDLLACFQFMLCPTNPDGSGADCKMAPQIVSNSWGGGQGLSTFDSTINALRTAGIIPVVAAGNTGPNCGTTQSPGDNANVITVGATNGTDFVASFSAKGPTVNGLRKPDVMGPGSSIRSSCWTGDGDYCNKSGTSMATPHVSGAIAIYLSARPGSTFDQIKDKFQSKTMPVKQPTGFTCGATADRVKPNNQFGFGRIDISLALS